MSEGRALAVATMLRLGYTGTQVSEILKLTDAGKLDEAMELAREFNRETRPAAVAASGSPTGEKNT